jgi:hypothetical protein
MSSPTKTVQTQSQRQNQARAGVDPDTGVYRGPAGGQAKSGEGSRADSRDGTHSDGDLPALDDARDTAERH